MCPFARAKRRRTSRTRTVQRVHSSRTHVAQVASLTGDDKDDKRDEIAGNGAETGSRAEQEEEIPDELIWRNKANSPITKETTRKPRRPRGCGTTTKTKTRIAGGRPADPKEWPWMAALLRQGTIQYCGGVLITDRHVLTAAHCVYK